MLGESPGPSVLVVEREIQRKLLFRDLTSRGRSWDAARTTIGGPALPPRGNWLSVAIRAGELSFN
jgi:hypothetical protein